MNYLEIYNEELIDLIGEESPSMRIDGRLVNCPPTQVSSETDVFNLIRTAQQKVTIAKTIYNDRSSRSHTILILQYKIQRKDGKVIKAKLNLVDLAGSERLNKAEETSKEIQHESRKINQSLINLGMVIRDLNRNEKFIKYNSSKLTTLL